MKAHYKRKNRFRVKKVNYRCDESEFMQEDVNERDDYLEKDYCDDFEDSIDDLFLEDRSPSNQNNKMFNVGIIIPNFGRFLKMKNTKLLVSYALGLMLATSVPSVAANASSIGTLDVQRQVVAGVEDDVNLSFYTSYGKYLNYYNLDGHLTINAEMKSKSHSFTGAEVFISESPSDPYDKTLAYYSLGDRREMSQNSINKYVGVYGHTFSTTSNPFTEYKYNNSMSCDLELREWSEGKTLYVYVRFTTPEGYVSRFVSSGALNMDFSSPSITMSNSDSFVNILADDNGGAGIENLIIMGKDGSLIADNVAYESNQQTLEVGVMPSDLGMVIAKDRLGNVTTYNASTNEIISTIYPPTESDNYLNIDPNEIPDLVDNGDTDVQPPVETPDGDDGNVDVQPPVETPDAEEPNTGEDTPVQPPIETPSGDEDVVVTPEEDEEQIPSGDEDVVVTPEEDEEESDKEEEEGNETVVVTSEEDKEESNKEESNKEESNKEDNSTKFDQEDDISDLKKPILPQTGGVDSNGVLTLGSLITSLGFALTRKRK